MKRDLQEVLKDLALRALEYVGIEPHPELGDALEDDAEIRAKALHALELLGVDPAHELRRYLRTKRISKRRTKR